MAEKCPICGERLSSNKCPMCGYTARTSTWSQRTTACEECLTPEIPLTEKPIRNPLHKTECEDCHPTPSPHIYSDRFKNITPITAGKMTKSTLLLITVLFGWCGIHRLIMGKYVSGILYMTTFGLYGFGWLLDILLVLFGKFKDRNGYYII